MSQIRTKNIGTEKTLKEVIIPVTERISVGNLTVATYISTENMEVDIGGVRDAVNLPTVPNVLKFLPGDILFSNIRTYFKKLWQSDRVGGASNDVLIFRGNEELINKKYLFYVLSQNIFFEHTVKTSKGTKMPRGDKDAIFEFNIPLPPLLEQQAIVDTLSNFDSKIELLREQNKTLEATTQTMFQKWFGKYTVDDELPEGWKIGKFNESIQILSGGTPKTSVDEYWGGGDIPWFSVVDTPSDSLFVISTEKNITRLGLKKSAAQVLPIYTTIITARGTVGKLALTGVEMSINQSCYGIRSKFGKEFYTYLLTKHVLNILKSRVHGAVFDTITRETFSSVDVVIPNLTSITEFEEILNPIFHKIKSNTEEIQILSKTRDTLIPQLIGGMIRVI